MIKTSGARRICSTKWNKLAKRVIFYVIMIGLFIAFIDSTETDGTNGLIFARGTREKLAFLLFFCGPQRIQFATVHEKSSSFEYNCGSLESFVFFSDVLPFALLLPANFGIARGGKSSKSSFYPIRGKSMQMS